MQGNGNRLRWLNVARLLEFPRRDDSGEALNSQQRDAVRHGQGPLLVVAGAGTGKTRVITERMKHLLESDPTLSGENILGLTYTDKAAAEMKHRVVQSVGERGRPVCLGTFHWFCYSQILLPANPALQVLEDVDHWILLRRNMAELGLERFRRLAEPGQFLGDFVQFLSRCQDELVTPEDYEGYAAGLERRLERERDLLTTEEFVARAEEVAKQKEVAGVYRTSCRLLRERNLITFGGQLLQAVERLRSDAAARRALHSRFRHILVDEFQDTNIAQIELLWLLAGEHANIVAVGDDDQAIYRFRGASFGSFTLFLEKFAGIRVTPGAALQQVLPLTENYRSTGRILRVAGQVIAQNERSPISPDKRLTPHKSDGEKIRIVELGSPEEEAQWIAGELERLHRSGQRWSTFAVLFRMHVHRDRLVPALEARGIPFVIKNLSIFENTLVRDVLAYLRLIAVPWDNVACARALAAPGWGLEPSDLVRLCERAFKSRGMTLWEELQKAQGDLPFNQRGKRAAELVTFINNFRARAKNQTASELLDDLVAALEVNVLAEARDLRYLERLARFVREWEVKSERKTLQDFVEYLDYFEQAGGQIHLDEEPTDDAVQLMTVHAAKGLEFEHVFVMRLVQGGFPCWPRPRVLEFPVEMMKEERPKGDFHIQEERRLFYVALTRARENLTLTTVVQRRSKASVFLDDILMDATFARAHVQRLEPKPAAPPRPTATPLLAETPLFDALRDRARIYSRIASWAEEYRPPLAEPLTLSASAMDTYRTCPQKFLFQRVWGIREGPRAALSFGNVMHTTIKEFIAHLRRSRQMPFEEVEAIFLREWTSAGFEDSYQEQEYKKDGLEQLRAFHGACLAAAPEVLAQEKRFDLPMEADLVITGRIDQVNRWAGGQHEIVDYKTGRPKEERGARKDLQLSIYALAAREVLGLDPVRLIFYNLQTNEAIVTSRDDKELKNARAIIQELAADIRAGEFGAKPGFVCRTCEYRRICPAHEERAAIERAKR